MAGLGAVPSTTLRASPGPCRPPRPHLGGLCVAVLHLCHLQLAQAVLQPQLLQPPLPQRHLVFEGVQLVHLLPELMLQVLQGLLQERAESAASACPRGCVLLEALVSLIS